LLAGKNKENREKSDIFWEKSAIITTNLTEKGRKKISPLAWSRETY